MIDIEIWIIQREEYIVGNIESSVHILLTELSSIEGCYWKFSLQQFFMYET